MLKTQNLCCPRKGPANTKWKLVIRPGRVHLCSITMDVKKCYAHVTTQRILNKLIKINFSVRCMLWPWCCLFQHRLPVKILIRLVHIPQTIAMTLIKDMTHTGSFVMNRYPFLLCGIFLASNSSCNSFGRGMWAYGNMGCQLFKGGIQN